jgi:hypothetical protein
MSNFKIATQGLAWPFGDCVTVAVVDIEAERLSRILNTPLVQGTEPGLGSWQAIGLEFPGGLVVELIQHAHAPGSRGFELRVDRSCNSELALGQVVKALGGHASVLSWVAPGVRT